jgi:signal transduction histidine kinase
LHDDVQQMLMGARLYLRTLGKTKNAAKQNRIIKEIEEMLERSFNLTRSLSVELSPPVLHESGLAAALEWLGAQTRKHENIQVTVEADFSANPKAVDISVFLFRAVRELLLNALKRGAGSPVHIAMTSAGVRKVRIVVADRGPGFDPDMLNSHQTGLRGLGLFNIRQRMASIEGELQIKSAPGHGTRMILIAPRECHRKSADSLKNSANAAMLRRSVRETLARANTGLVECETIVLYIECYRRRSFARVSKGVSNEGP